MSNNRVGKELGQHKEDAALDNLQFRYDLLVDSIKGNGFNPGVFDAAIPMAVHDERAVTEAAQVEQLLTSGKAFFAPGQWIFRALRIGNAAQKQQLLLNETARLKVADKKNEAQLKTLEKAQTPLLKYQFHPQSLTEKDWGDVIR
jgi:hypothetical protein